MSIPEGELADPSRTPSGPLRRIVDALAAGAHSRGELAGLTGLDRDVVDAALDQLARLGRLRVERLAGGCPDLGCGTCASGRGDGQAGCGASGPATSPEPVALTLVTGRPG